MTARLVLAIAGVLAAAPAARAERSIVFPLSGTALPAARVDAPVAMTHALAQSIGASVASVPIEDVAGLLACDVESSQCLDGVSRSVNAERLVFGTVTARADGSLEVILTRFDPGPARDQRTFVVSGATDAELADALVVATRPLFPDDRRDQPAEVTAAVRLPDDPPVDTGSVRGGRPTAATWVLLGGGLALAGAGAGFLISADHIRDEVASAPRNTSADFEHLNQLEDRGTLRTRIGTVLIAAGGVALAIGAIRAVAQARRPARREQATRLDPVVLPGGAGLVLTLEVP